MPARGEAVVAVLLPGDLESLFSNRDHLSLEVNNVAVWIRDSNSDVMCVCYFRLCAVCEGSALCFRSCLPWGRTADSIDFGLSTSKSCLMWRGARHSIQIYYLKLESIFFLRRMADIRLKNLTELLSKIVFDHLDHETIVPDGCRSSVPVVNQYRI